MVDHYPQQHPPKSQQDARSAWFLHAADYHSSLRITSGTTLGSNSSGELTFSVEESDHALRFDIIEGRLWVTRLAGEIDVAGNDVRRYALVPDGSDLLIGNLRVRISNALEALPETPIIIQEPQPEPEPLNKSADVAVESTASKDAPKESVKPSSPAPTGADSTVDEKPAIVAKVSVPPIETGTPPHTAPKPAPSSGPERPNRALGAFFICALIGLVAMALWWFSVGRQSGQPAVTQTAAGTTSEITTADDRPETAISETGHPQARRETPQPPITERPTADGPALKPSATDQPTATPDTTASGSTATLAQSRQTTDADLLQTLMALTSRPAELAFDVDSQTRVAQMLLSLAQQPQQQGVAQSQAGQWVQRLHDELEGAERIQALTRFSSLVGEAPQLHDVDTTVASLLADAKHLNRLSRRLQEQLRDGYLTLPVGNNAVATASVMLQLDPDNAEALDAMTESAARLLAAAQQAHASGLDFEARNLVEEVLGFHPTHAGALEAWAELQRAP